jgi:hypothetical protein
MDSRRRTIRGVEVVSIGRPVQTRRTRITNRPRLVRIRQHALTARRRDCSVRDIHLIQRRRIAAVTRDRERKPGVGIDGAGFRTGGVAGGRAGLVALAVVHIRGRSAPVVWDAVPRGAGAVGAQDHDGRGQGVASAVGTVGDGTFPCVGGIVTAECH